MPPCWTASWLARTVHQAGEVMRLKQGLWGLVADLCLGSTACLLLLKNSAGVVHFTHRLLHLLHSDVSTRDSIRRGQLGLDVTSRPTSRLGSMSR